MKLQNQEASILNNGKVAHSDLRNYDDFNEYFWPPTCFELNWPLKKNSSFLLHPKGRKRTGKSRFVEHQPFLHLYRTFLQPWILLILMFQSLTIIAFNDGILSTLLPRKYSVLNRHLLSCAS